MADNAADAKRHMLTSLAYDWSEDGDAQPRPVAFAEEVATSRRSLADDALDEERRTLTISGVEALVCTSLLREFAERLRRDAGAGVIAPDAGQLAALAEEMVDRLRAAGASVDGE